MSAHPLLIALKTEESKNHGKKHQTTHDVRDELLRSETERMPCSEAIQGRSRLFRGTTEQRPLLRSSLPPLQLQ